MARTLKPASSGDVAAVRRAVRLMREARGLLASAGAEKAEERATLAISSTLGALRHVERRAMHTK